MADSKESLVIKHYEKKINAASDMLSTDDALFHQAVHGSLSGISTTEPLKQQSPGDMEITDAQ